MKRITKFCDLIVYTLSGATLEGCFHMDASLSSAIRPSDAIREISGPYLLLTDVSVSDDGAKREVGTVMVRAEGIAYIELRSRSWRST